MTWRSYRGEQSGEEMHVQLTAIWSPRYYSRLSKLFVDKAFSMSFSLPGRDLLGYCPKHEAMKDLEAQ
jgi:hypothetical protein